VRRLDPVPRGGVDGDTGRTCIDTADVLAEPDVGACCCGRGGQRLDDLPEPAARVVEEPALPAARRTPDRYPILRERCRSPWQA
jgi:hypothetical protein